MQTNASKFDFKQATASKCKQMQAKASKSKQMQAKASNNKHTETKANKGKQTQTNLSTSKQNQTSVSKCKQRQAKLGGLGMEGRGGLWGPWRGSRHLYVLLSKRYVFNRFQTSPRGPPATGPKRVIKTPLLLNPRLGPKSEKTLTNGLAGLIAVEESEILVIVSFCLKRTQART